MDEQRLDEEGASVNRYLPPTDRPRGGITKRRRYRDEVASRFARLFHWVIGTPDGADKSGLIPVSYATMANAAVDAALAVALANTVFFAEPATGGVGGAALYLLLTLAPFAFVAPLIGPALDRLQHGRRVVLASSFGLRTSLVLALMFNYDSQTDSYPPWVLYPCALAAIVLSKSFAVMRSALLPRVAPPATNFVRLNSHTRIAALVGGVLVGGGAALGLQYGYSAALASVSELVRTWHLRMDLQPALLVCAAATLLGTILSMRMPQWIERAGVAMAFSYHGSAKQATSHLRTSLWGNLVIKVSVGFLFVYPAFVVQAQPEAGSRELVALSIIGVAATVGTLVGSTATDRMAFAHPPKVVMCCAIAVTTATAVAVAVGNLYAIAVAALAVSLCSAFGKAALDSVIQGESPEESLVSSFGRYEALLQIGWVAGGVVAMLSPAIPCWGLLVVSSILVSGLAVTILSYSDRTRVWGRKLCRLLPVGNGSGA